MPAPSFGELMHFHMMRTVYSGMKDYLPEDHGYWKTKGWLEKGCAYFIQEPPANPLKASLPRIAGALMGVFMKGRMKK